MISLEKVFKTLENEYQDECDGHDISRGLCPSVKSRQIRALASVLVDLMNYPDHYQQEAREPVWVD